jgi:TetR/AcrR family transcriptional regulator, transcriptional repressor for nem operon
MPKVVPDKRSRLMQAALKLVYRRGFERTALADIAHEAKVPLGNVYYYFKTKAQIGEAIVEQRLAGFRAMRQEWERMESAKERLLGFVQMTIDSQAAVARFGCPIGTFCSELHKEGGPLAKKSTVLFAESLAWIESQFRALGKVDSHGLAVHLLSALQGASVLAHAFRDPDVLAMEAGRISDWIRAL